VAHRQRTPFARGPHDRIEVVIRKLANAFIPGASPSDLVPANTLSVINRFKRKWGGLWVGGRVSISPSGVSFSPNTLNRVLHEPLEPIHTLATDIRSVTREFGWFTGIVVVAHKQGEFRFRCYGAKKMAATMAVCLDLS
jgi:hypothetical protein